MQPEPRPAPTGQRHVEASVAPAVPRPPGTRVWPQPGPSALGLLPLLQLGSLPKVPGLGDSGAKMNPVPRGSQPPHSQPRSFPIAHVKGSLTCLTRERLAPQESQARLAPRVGDRRCPTSQQPSGPFPAPVALSSGEGLPASCCHGLNRKPPRGVEVQRPRQGPVPSLLPRSPGQGSGGSQPVLPGAREPPG